MPPLWGICLIRTPDDRFRAFAAKRLDSVPRLLGAFDRDEQTRGTERVATTPDRSDHLGQGFFLNETEPHTSSRSTKFLSSKRISAEKKDKNKLRKLVLRVKTYRCCHHPQTINFLCEELNGLICTSSSDTSPHPAMSWRECLLKFSLEPFNLPLGACGVPGNDQAPYRFTFSLKGDYGRRLLALRLLQRVVTLGRVGGMDGNIIVGRAVEHLHNRDIGGNGGDVVRSPDPQAGRIALGQRKGDLSLLPSYLGSGYCGDTRIRSMDSGGLSKDGDLRKVRGWELVGEHGLEANFGRVHVLSVWGTRLRGAKGRIQLYQTLKGVGRWVKKSEDGSTKGKQMVKSMTAKQQTLVSVAVRFVVFTHISPRSYLAMGLSRNYVASATQLGTDNLKYVLLTGIIGSVGDSTAVPSVPLSSVAQKSTSALSRNKPSRGNTIRDHDVTPRKGSHTKNRRLTHDEYWSQSGGVSSLMPVNNRARARAPVDK
ncbi:hypothetical protein ARMSODRAFT_980694 [Armillaria solidipes]|uniref:Uncharacterized protein n=1 Tax=Armillaria solidipes TaxID=1076256 RepID=A0A2H3B8P6_9AGAR|nr:hypothetical protein ARMSODRAFT_980694 [Armillaria solidipes]